MAPHAAPPEWVTEWLASREQRGERAQAGAEKKQSPPDPEAQARRQAKRDERVQAGLEELERWLHDLARQGLAQARQRPYGFWDEAAARLVDAQASALAGRLQTLGGLAVAGGDRWADELLEDDHGNAAALAALGCPVFACTPAQFPPLMAAAIEGRDINLWAAGQGIAGARAG